MRRGAPIWSITSVLLVPIRRCAIARESGKFCAEEAFISSVFGMGFVIATQWVHAGGRPADQAARSLQFPPVVFIQTFVTVGGVRAPTLRIPVEPRINTPRTREPFVIPVCSTLATC